MNQDCLICFSNFEPKDQIKCPNPQCSATICFDCARALIEYAEKNSIIPTCPSVKCRTMYTQSTFNKLDGAYIAMYNNCCMLEMLTDRGKNVEKIIEQEKILEELRQKRKKFVDTNFPVAVSFVATKLMKSKLRSLEKSNIESVSKKINKSNRYCMSLFCNGFLDGGDTVDFKCMKCDAIFCKDCEKIKNDSHSCKPEDIESIKSINQMVKCPKCKLPIFKNVGCNHIHCRNCGTHFDYITGLSTSKEDEGWGEISNDIAVDIKEKVYLSKEFGSKLSNAGLAELIKIENKQPEIVNDKVLISLLKAAITKNERHAGKIARELDRIITSTLMYKYYQTILQSIEKIFYSGNVPTLDELIKINKMI
jgi:hypothetical protein